MSRFARFALIGACAFWHGVVLAEPQLTSSEVRGKAAYFGQSGSVLDAATARIEGTDFDLPASSFPCASCHGTRGQGRSERGVQPTNLTRSSLTRPYDVRMQAGRVRPGYTEELFIRAVQTGIDSGGNQLNSAMPRFDLDNDALADIWAFLGKIDVASDPGVAEAGITIGVYLGHDLQTSHAKDIRHLLEAFADDINALGGIHGRKLEWDWLQTGDAAHSVFAVMLSPSRHSVVLTDDVPILGWWGESRPDAKGFRLVAGPDEQLAALRMYAVQAYGRLAPPDACEGAEDEVLIASEPGCLETINPKQTILMPHDVFSAMSSDQRNSIKGSVYVALPVDFSAVSPQARSNFARLRARAGSSGQYILDEARAYTAAALLTEALVRTGRQIDREKFVETLEDVREFRGGISHAMTFAPNDHTGSNGALIVRYNKDTRSLESKGVWVDPTHMQ